MFSSLSLAEGPCGRTMVMLNSACIINYGNIETEGLLQQKSQYDPLFFLFKKEELKQKLPVSFLVPCVL